MRFLATRFEEDGEYMETFEADSMESAEEICKANGWLLDGELGATIPYDPDQPIPSMEVH